LNYSCETTNINSKDLCLTTLSQLPTLITFSSTTSTNNPLLSISNGRLQIHYLSMIYDSSNVDTFISLDGEGEILLKKVTITSYSDISLEATKSFIILNGEGIINIEESELKEFASNNKFISILGSGKIILNNNTIKNITFSGSGTLINSVGDIHDNGEIKINNSNISNITSSGRIININGIVYNIEIINNNLSSLSNGGSGGCIYVSNIYNILMKENYFINCESTNGNGGAIFLNENTGFSIESYYFFCFIYLLFYYFYYLFLLFIFFMIITLEYVKLILCLLLLFPFFLIFLFLI
jgi:hypothetical protein